MLTPHIKMVSLSNPSKCHSRKSIVNKEAGIMKTVFLCVFFKYGLLVFDAARKSVLLVVAAQATV